MSDLVKLRETIARLSPPPPRGPVTWKLVAWLWEDCTHAYLMQATDADGRAVAWCSVRDYEAIREALAA